MNLQDVLTLAAAGYTRDEILAFETQQTIAPAPAPAPAPNSAPAPAPTPAPAPVPAGDQLQAFLATMHQAEQPNVAQAFRGMGQNVPQNLQQYQQPIQQPQQIQAPAPAVQQAQPSSDARAEQILQSLGNLVQGVALPNPELTIEEKLQNTLLAALGVKQGEKEK